MFLLKLSQLKAMNLNTEQKFEKETLKRYLEENPEQATKILWELFGKMIQGRKQQKKLEFQYDELLQRYVNLHEAYLTNLQLIHQNGGPLIKISLSTSNIV